MGLPHVYLGYWVEGSRKMAYKGAYLPQERLGLNGWTRVERETDEPRQFRHDRLARRASRRRRPAGDRRLLASADDRAQGRRGVSRGPYPRRGVLQHRRHRRHVDRPAAHAAGRRPPSPARWANSASATACASSSTIRWACSRRRGCGGRCAPSARKDVFILEGGLPKWMHEGRPIEAGEAQSEARDLHAAARTRDGGEPRRREGGAGERLGAGGGRPPRRPFRGPRAGAAAGAEERPHAGRAQPALRRGAGARRG